LSDELDKPQMTDGNVNFHGDEQTGDDRYSTRRKNEGGADVERQLMNIQCSIIASVETGISRPSRQSNDKRAIVFFT